MCDVNVSVCVPQCPVFSGSSFCLKQASVKRVNSESTLKCSWSMIRGVALLTKCVVWAPALAMSLLVVLILREETRRGKQRETHPHTHLHTQAAAGYHDTGPTAIGQGWVTDVRLRLSLASIRSKTGLVSVNTSCPSPSSPGLCPVYPRQCDMGRSCSRDWPGAPCLLYTTCRVG